MNPAGVVSAFDALCRAVDDDAVVCGPRGHALVPTEIAGAAGHLRFGGRRLPRPAAAREIPVPAAIEDAGLVALWFEIPGHAADRAWLAGLAAVRLEQSRALLNQCMAHLGGRTSGGLPLTRQQLVMGELADVAAAQAEVDALLPAGGAEPPVTGLLNHAHRLLTDVDRRLLQLFGAHGFTADGPGRDAYVSELLAGIYVEAAR